MSSTTGPADSHVASTDQDHFGEIFRRNMPYGTVTDHGTMFVGFGATQDARAMLASMAGLDSGTRDALTRYTSRSPAPTTSCRRPKRSAGSRGSSRR